MKEKNVSFVFISWLVKKDYEKFKVCSIKSFLGTAALMKMKSIEIWSFSHLICFYLPITLLLFAYLIY